MFGQDGNFEEALKIVYQHHKRSRKDACKLEILSCNSSTWGSKI